MDLRLENFFSRWKLVKPISALKLTIQLAQDEI
jgi:hypothetical protein